LYHLGGAAFAFDKGAMEIYQGDRTFCAIHASFVIGLLAATVLDRQQEANEGS